jgi:SseB protein N-terminal domain
MQEHSQSWEDESFYPENKLERALLRAANDPVNHPAMWRAMWREELHFLMPYHPEMEGVAQIREGDELPLISWTDTKGQYVPIFSSAARIPTPGQKGAPAFCLGTMPGEVLFRFLAPLKLRVILNANHAPNLVMQPETVRAFSRGEMTGHAANSDVGPPEQSKLQSVPLDAFPELNRVLRAHCDKCALLAGLYLFHPIDQSEFVDTTDLRIVLWAKQHDDAFFNDLAIVARASNPPVKKLSIGVVDHTNPEAINFLQNCKPIWPVLPE